MAKVLDKARGKLSSVALEELKVEYISPDTLQPNSYNPNRQNDDDFALLKQSMQDAGFTQPILVRRDGNVIVDGEHRWRAARDLGFPEVPVVYVDFTDAQMKLATLRHNRARGQDELDKLGAMLRDLEKMGGLKEAQQQLGLSSDDLAGLIGDITASESLADENGSYTDSWEPSDRTTSDDLSAVSDKRLVGTTPAARVAALQVETAIAALPSSLNVQDRKEKESSLRKEARIYRLNLVYSGDEANLLKTVLGVDGAGRFLEFCQKVLGV